MRTKEYDLEKIKRQVFEEKLSYESIGKEYGVSEAAIKKFLIRGGIKPQARRVINEKETFGKGVISKPIVKCIECGKEFYGYKKATCSDECYASYLKRRSKKYINNVTKESLLEAFKKFKTFKKVGEHFNISDSMAHRWYKEFGLPHTVKEMKKYISI